MGKWGWGIKLFLTITFRILVQSYFVKKCSEKVGEEGKKMLACSICLNTDLDFIF